MDDKVFSEGVSKDEFTALMHNKTILSMAIKACVKDAKDMGLESIGECLELEEDGTTVRGVEINDARGCYEGLLDNVFRLRIPDKGEILVVFNKG